MFDLQDYRVRAAVRQVLKNVAYASSARPRGSAGPIRAKPFYCQFDLPVRRRPIGPYEVFFVLCHLVPIKLNIRRASRARKLVLPKARGPESQRSVGATDIQRFHTIGVFRWSRTFPRSPRGTPPGTSWPGAPQPRSGLLPPLRQISCTSRLLLSSSCVFRTAPPRR